MRTLLLTVAILCASSVSGWTENARLDALLTDMEKKMHSFCVKEWPADFRMQKYCFDRQFSGAIEFRQIVTTIKTTDPLVPALLKCLDEWSSATVADWRMVGYCAKQQQEAYRQLQ